MKPEITECDRKLARNPRRNSAMASRIRPDSSASTSAAATYWGEPGSATAPAAAAVIRDTTATGPTARVRLVPKIA